MLIAGCSTNPNVNSADGGGSVSDQEETADSPEGGQEVSFKGLRFSIPENWENQESTDSTRGYKVIPCLETYCNNLYISFVRLDNSYNHLDWSALLSTYAAELNSSGMKEMNILNHNYGERKDSTWYELRYSYQNDRGHVLISELHFIWPKSSELYIFDFTAKDLPRGTFTDFKIDEIDPFSRLIRY